jgi:transcription initiation factor IIE alpha subunit
MLHKELHMWEVDELNKKEKEELEKRTFPCHCRICDTPEPIARLSYDLQGTLQITCPHCGTGIVILAIDLDTPDYKNIANA